MATGSIEREERQVRHARIELSPRNHERLRAAADRDRRTMASYMRLAVLDRIAADEARATEKGNGRSPFSPSNVSE